jgi:CubicO group peptidase (beta-lactamase class C family)
MTIRFVHARVVLLALLCAGIAPAQNPGRQWMMYKSPEDAGWSSDKLISICRVANANAVLLVHKGKVVFAYGQYWRRVKCHSMRKSFLGGLYGIAVQRGTIDTLETIARLRITNNPPLTETESQARIVDLLACRSGIYLPSGQESEDMRRSRPERGSHRPSTSWYYNNWDFNVLGTIFRRVTGRDIFEAFQADIAAPLQMEDFRRMDGVYEVTPADSLHPGYMFKMSARDAARFGQLYLQNGVWDRKEVVPRSWVERSTTSHSATTTPGTSYGLLWWIVEDFRGVRMYYAAGYGGQRICVIPASELVIVINSDTYSNNAVFDVDYMLPDLVFAARVGKGVSNPEFIPLKEPLERRMEAMDEATQHRYVGDYVVDEIPVTISQSDNGLILDGYHYSYKFCLLPISQTMFRVEDIDLLLVADLDVRGGPAHMALHKSPVTYELYRLIMDRGVGPAAVEFPWFAARLRQKEELEYLCGQLKREGVPTRALRELNAVCFPYSYKVQRDLKDELLAAAGLAEAARVFRELADTLGNRGLTGAKTEWFANILTAFVSPGTLTTSEMQDLVGVYGYRRVASENGSLYYRTDGSTRKLYRISDERFAIEGTYNMVIEFGRDESGAVNKITGRYYRDSFDETYRTP